MCPPTYSSGSTETFTGNSVPIFFNLLRNFSKIFSDFQRFCVFQLHIGKRFQKCAKVRLGRNYKKAANRQNWYRQKGAVFIWASFCDTNGITGLKTFFIIRKKILKFAESSSRYKGEQMQAAVRSPPTTFTAKNKITVSSVSPFKSWNQVQ